MSDLALRRSTPRFSSREYTEYDLASLPRDLQNKAGRLEGSRPVSNNEALGLLMRDLNRCSAIPR